ncbi:hypothetical protein Zm00014a_044057 [Zea mays]|uniref:Uncharacterized protein n=1 Tax=Zea mays TaxID=4577 RepID=A0A317YHM5_MAIZE|nr:hypothetical protein Zm00014a_044057 [Zea mays]
MLVARAGDPELTKDGYTLLNEMLSYVMTYQWRFRTYAYLLHSHTLPPTKSSVIRSSSIPIPLLPVCVCSLSSAIEGTF